MYHKDLFKKVLIAPALEGANNLKIVAGYASVAMAARHLQELLVTHQLDVSIELIVGMTPLDGISVMDHLGFQNFVSDSFSCKYVIRGPAVHSKLYVWSNVNGPCYAFVGSANYTQTAFLRHREILVSCEPGNALAYFDSLVEDTMHCEHPRIAQHVNIHSGKQARPAKATPRLFDEDAGSMAHLESAVLSLLTRDGTRVHARSGLNWGQREEEGREPNQAYIPVYAPLKNTDFFPPRGVYFTAHTDDGHTLILTRAQDGDKAIQTPWDNSELGRYFRRRLGLASGAFITKEDLERYGRTDVTFYKIDDETYFMDFSIPKA